MELNSQLLQTVRGMSVEAVHQDQSLHLRIAAQGVSDETHIVVLHGTPGHIHDLRHWKGVKPLGDAPSQYHGDILFWTARTGRCHSLALEEAGATGGVRGCPPHQHYLPGYTHACRKVSSALVLPPSLERQHEIQMSVKKRGHFRSGRSRLLLLGECCADLADPN